MANSRIKKVDGVANLYVDEVTGIYLIRIYHEQKSRSKSLGTKSLSIAKQKISSAIKDIITTDKRKVRNKLVRDYVPGFISSLEAEELSKATLAQRDVSWRYDIEPFWGNISDGAIDQNLFTEYLVWHKRNRGTKIFNSLKYLRRLFRYMKLNGAPVGFVEITVPKKEQDASNEEKGTYLSHDEFSRIYVNSLDHRYRIMFNLAYVFGFRIGELANLRKNRIKIVDGRTQIHLRQEDTKTRKARIVPLTQVLGQDLEFWLNKTDSAFVFPAIRNYKEPTSKQVIERVLKRAVKDAGIHRNVTFHDFRKSAATNMANLELDAVKACTVLGMTLKIYMSTYVKKHKLDLSSIADALSKPEGRS